jgi:hypothetical protein
MNNSRKYFTRKTPQPVIDIAPILLVLMVTFAAVQKIVIGSKLAIPMPLPIGNLNTTITS